MSMSSAHTKHHLEDLHERIRCVRHPDHLGGEVTLFYSHHEKIVVVDNLVACIGGLDMCVSLALVSLLDETVHSHSPSCDSCFGRWDTGAFPLADLHPTDMSRTIFPGQDLNNARIQDFVEVDKWAANNPQRTEAARMPWHDVHSMLVGPAVLDISQHFVERASHFLPRAIVKSLALPPRSSSSSIVTALTSSPSSLLPSSLLPAFLLPPPLLRRLELHLRAQVPPQVALPAPRLPAHRRPQRRHLAPPAL